MKSRTIYSLFCLASAVLLILSGGAVAADCVKSTEVRYSHQSASAIMNLMFELAGKEGGATYPEMMGDDQLNQAEEIVRWRHDINLSDYSYDRLMEWKANPPLAATKAERSFMEAVMGKAKHSSDVPSPSNGKIVANTSHPEVEPYQVKKLTRWYSELPACPKEGRCIPLDRLKPLHWMAAETMNDLVDRYKYASVRVYPFTAPMMSPELIDLVSDGLTMDRDLRIAEWLAPGIDRLLWRILPRTRYEKKLWKAIGKLTEGIKKTTDFPVFPDPRRPVQVLASTARIAVPQFYLNRFADMVSDTKSIRCEIPPGWLPPGTSYSN